MQQEAIKSFQKYKRKLKILGTRGGRHGASFIVNTHKYYAPLYNIQFPETCATL